MFDVKPTIPIILNVKELNNPIKFRDCQTGFKKERFN